MHTHTCTHTQTLVYHTMHMVHHTRPSHLHTRAHTRACTHARACSRTRPRMHKYICTHHQREDPTTKVHANVRMALSCSSGSRLVFILIFKVCHSSPTANGRSVTRFHFKFHVSKWLVEQPAFQPRQNKLSLKTSSHFRGTVVKSSMSFLQNGRTVTSDQFHNSKKQVHTHL